MKFSIKNFFSKCDRKLRILSHFLKKSLMEKFNFCPGRSPPDECFQQEYPKFLRYSDNRSLLCSPFYLVSDMAVLCENVTFSILYQYFQLKNGSFLKKGYRFKVKMLKMLKISSGCHIRCLFRKKFLFQSNIIEHLENFQGLPHKNMTTSHTEGYFEMKIPSTTFYKNICYLCWL